MTRTQSLSNDAFSKAKKLFPGGVNSPVRAFRSVGGEPFVVARGEGPYLYDLDGNRYVDYINSWGPLVLGHAHPAVIEALERQLRDGTSYGACAVQEIALAEMIMECVPSIEMLRFVNSGTEAGMAVLRLARGFTKRQKILKFAGCYHGHADSFLVQAGSGVATLGLPNSPGVPSQVAQDTLTVEFNDAEAVAECFRAHPGQIAALIVEPVVGNAGFIVPQGNFLGRLRELCSEHGALLIFDEVMTGFRVALSGAQGMFGVKPDLTMLGKVIGGGLPVGAFGGRRDIMEQLAPLGPVYQAGTLSGNPLAMVAGAATLREWRSAGVFERTATVTTSLVQAFREIAGETQIDLVAESLGTMFGFFFSGETIHSYADAKRSNQERFKRFFWAMLERGVYFAPSAFEAGFVSAVHDRAAFDYTVSALRNAFADLSPD